MGPGMLARLYRRLGGRYPLAFLTVELHSALVVVAGSLALFGFYWDAEWREALLILAVALALTEVAILAVLFRAARRVRPIRAWIEGDRGPEATERAWAAAVTLPLALVKRDLPLPVTLSVAPLCVFGVAVLDLSWLSLFPVLAASAVAAGYAAMLHYLVVEAGMRPVLVEISAARASPRTADVPAIPLRWRLMAALPLINLVTGLVVAGLTSEGGGGSNLGLDVLVAVAVATTISLELTVMLSRSILRPIGDLERAVDAVRAGDYTVSVPITTGDELGALATQFNEMVEGLRERERIREALGTYLDRDIAEYILSDGFGEEGAEVEVSILFTDVRDFTAFAARSTPAEVVAALNRLFEVIVPIISRHGGHVDKFVGDGLLAVFGAPEPFTDHADRAVRAACEIGAAVNDRAEAGDLRVGIGVNSGTVVAGAIGGAGRLNFSVIGNAVNVAARVEAATREHGDSILITGETWKRLSSEFEAERRGELEIAGQPEPETLYAPRLVGAEEAPAPGAATTAPDPAPWRRRLRRPRVRR